jgi:hypothetical protein
MKTLGLQWKLAFRVFLRRCVCVGVSDQVHELKANAETTMKNVNQILLFGK